MKTLIKADAGQYLKYGLQPKKYEYTFKVTPENFLPIGFALGPRHFKINQFVDVTATSIGKGT